MEHMLLVKKKKKKKLSKTTSYAYALKSKLFEPTTPSMLPPLQMRKGENLRKVGEKNLYV
jgi:hypothetical protein